MAARMDPTVEALLEDLSTLPVRIRSVIQLHRGGGMEEIPIDSSSETDDGSRGRRRRRGRRGGRRRRRKATDDDATTERSSDDFDTEPASSAARTPLHRVMCTGCGMFWRRDAVDAHAATCADVYSDDESSVAEFSETRTPHHRVRCAGCATYWSREALEDHARACEGLLARRDAEDYSETRTRKHRVRCMGCGLYWRKAAHRRHVADCVGMSEVPHSASKRSRAVDKPATLTLGAVRTRRGPLVAAAGSASPVA